MLDGLVGGRVGVIESEHVAGADLEFVGDGGDLALDAEVGLEAVPQPGQESGLVRCRLAATYVFRDRSGSAQARVRCSAGRSSCGCPSRVLGVALSWRAFRSGAVARRGSRRVCECARSSVARPRR
jgi:hypothetical protein